MSSDFLHVEIEATNICNTRCLHCPHESISRPSGKMDGKTFQAIFSKITASVEDFSIEFSGMGEPLLNPLIYDFIKTVSKKGDASLTTNGAALTPRNIQRLIDAGLKQLTVSFNGTNKAVYELMMGGLNFEQAQENLKLAVEMTGDSGTEVGANVIVTKQTQEFIGEIIDFLKKAGINRIYLAKCHNRGGHLKGDFVCSTPAPISDIQRCDIFTGTMFVSWTGDVLSCCHDLAGANIMGNLVNVEIETIQQRKRHIAEEGVKFDICRKCNDLQRFMKDITPDGSPLYNWIYNLYSDKDVLRLPEVSPLSDWLYDLYSQEGQVEKFSKILVPKASKFDVLNEQSKALKKEFGVLNRRFDDQKIHLRNYKKEVREKATQIGDLKNQIEDKNIHIGNYKKEIENKDTRIRHIDTQMNMILESKVWRTAEFLRKLFYVKILKFFPALQRSMLTVTREGFRSLWKKKEIMKPGDTKPEDLYDIWLRNNFLSEEKKRVIRDKIDRFSYKPKISIILPVYNVAEIWLKKAIDSVFAQLYENWELCIVDDASPKNHIRKVLSKYKSHKKVKLKFLKDNGGIAQSSNEALSLATGEFVGFLDHDDELSPDALYENVKILNLYPDADLIYSDEDKLNPEGKRIEPHFKPSWSPDLLLSYNYICHFSVYRKTKLDQINGLRSGFEGSQDYDLLLRLTEKTDKIHHIPKVLYHWRQIKGSTSTEHKEKISHIDNSITALQETLKRRKIEGTVEKGINFKQFESYRIKRKLTQKPLISIIIPMKDKVSYLKKNLKSIEEKTEYDNYEIVIVDNNSKEKETFDYLKSLEEKKSIRILQYKSEFNFSKINNYAVSQVEGEHVLFLNNDIEVISRGWLSAMLEHSQRKEVGAVGAKLVFPNNTIQHAGTIIGLGGTAGHSHKHIPVESSGYFGALNTIRNYSAITAACMMIRKDVFEDVGGFDEKKLAVAFNDVDLCLKIRKKGYLIVYTPFAALYHYESVSRGYDLNPREITAMNSRWGDILLSDPYYNPNLCLDSEDFKININ